MFRSICLVVGCTLAPVFVVGGQQPARDDPVALLTELGNMLDEIPNTKEDCKALLERIKDWQIVRLKEFRQAYKALAITSPAPNAKVGARAMVEGTVGDATATVWVVVHPLEVSDYWVQPRVTVKEDGNWKVMAYFGEAGRAHRGKRFEIMAVRNPKDRLSEGNKLAFWPEAEQASQVVEVLRN